ncbi:hypothetical protein [Klebsiella quasipneumoniae]|uniref:hypothetical protein n=1 Tax=Klebsiella quasipneumoniae TaxID=1463165 RepID=UPI00388CF32A
MGNAAAAHAIYEGFTDAIKPANLVMAYWGFLATLLLALENRSDEELLEAIGLPRACAIPPQPAGNC